MAPLAADVRPSGGCLRALGRTHIERFAERQLIVLAGDAPGRTGAAFSMGASWVVPPSWAGPLSSGGRSAAQFDALVDSLDDSLAAAAAGASRAAQCPAPRCPR